MRYVCTSKNAVVRAVMAHMFIERAYRENHLNEIYNMNDVLKDLDPNNIIDGFIKNYEERVLVEEVINETN